MGQESYQGIGSIGYGGGGQPSGKKSQPNGVGLSGNRLWVLPGACLVVLIVLIIIAIVNAAGPSERAQTKVANRFVSIVNDYRDSVTKPADMEWMAERYPGSFGERLFGFDKAIEEYIKENIVYPEDDEGKVLEYERINFIELEENELEKNAAHISLMKDMENVDISVTAGSLISYKIVTENGKAWELSVLILECNDELGVWGVYQKPEGEADGTGYHYFWDIESEEEAEE